VSGSDIGSRQENLVDTFVMLRNSWLILDMAGAVFVTGIAVNIAGAIPWPQMATPVLFACGYVSFACASCATPDHRRIACCLRVQPGSQPVLMLVQACT